MSEGKTEEEEVATAKVLYYINYIVLFRCLILS